MTKPKIFMTGATGLVGSRFVELYGDRYDIVNMDLTTGVDITDISTFEGVISQHPDATSLIHLAAFTDTDKAFKESGDKSGICYRVNVGGTENIAKICLDHGIHMIHISTDFVFDGKQVEPYTEDSVPNPLDWYGETKAISEAVVRDSGVSHTIVRLSYPYRAHFEAKPDIVRKIRLGLESGELSPQFSDTIITPTLTDDIARAFSAIVDKRPMGIFHIVGSTPVSPYELAVKVAESYGFDQSLVRAGKLTEYLESAHRPYAKSLAMSNQKARELLGVEFATLDSGIATIKQQQGI